jgi:hypothetical protein
MTTLPFAIRTKQRTYVPRKCSFRAHVRALRWLLTVKCVTKRDTLRHEIRNGCVPLNTATTVLRTSRRTVLRAFRNGVRPELP